jgi:hypothetical protein
VSKQDSIGSRLRRNEPWFVLFLLAVLLPILTLPFTDLEGNILQRVLLPLSSLMLAIVSLRMIPSDILRLGRWRPFVFYRPLGCLSALVMWLLFILGHHLHHWHVPVLLIISAFYLATALGVVLMLAQVTRVNEAVLCLGAAGYVHLGLTGGQLATMLERLQPGSFHLGRMVPGQELVERLSYYAFVTLGSLGYGDVLPATSVAESFAVMLSLASTLYMTLMIGLLISRYINAANRSGLKGGVGAPLLRSRSRGSVERS